MIEQLQFPELVDIKGAATHLCTSIRHVRRLVQEDELDSVKIGGKLRTRTFPAVVAHSGTRGSSETGPCAWRTDSSSHGRVVRPTTATRSPRRFAQSGGSHSELFDRSTQARNVTDRVEPNPFVIELFGEGMRE